MGESITRHYNPWDWSGYGMLRKILIEDPSIKVYSSKQIEDTSGNIVGEETLYEFEDFYFRTVLLDSGDLTTRFELKKGASWDNLVISSDAFYDILTEEITF